MRLKLFLLFNLLLIIQVIVLLTKLYVSNFNILVTEFDYINILSILLIDLIILTYPVKDTEK